MTLHHKDLDVWQKAHKLTLEIYSITKSFPKEETYGIVTQLRRAALAVATNIAEGGARRSRKEYAQFCSIARGSASEVAYLLLVSRDLGYLTQEVFVSLILSRFRNLVSVDNLIQALRVSVQMNDKSAQLTQDFVDLLFGQAKGFELGEQLQHPLTDLLQLSQKHASAPAQVPCLDLS